MYTLQIRLSYWWTISGRKVMKLNDQLTSTPYCQGICRGRISENIHKSGILEIENVCILKNFYSIYVYLMLWIVKVVLHLICKVNLLTSAYVAAAGFRFPALRQCLFWHCYSFLSNELPSRSSKKLLFCSWFQLLGR